MPANPRSLQLTDAYRRRLVQIGNGVEAEARQRWPSIETLDASDWPEQMARSLTRAQTEAVRLTAGYLGAFLRLEGSRGTVPAIDSRKYAGKSRDGRPLAEALQSPLIGVRAALKDGHSPAGALKLGLVRGTRTVSFETVQAGRDALLETVEFDDRVLGWQRSVSGTCAACMALSGTSGPRFEVHPNCACVPMPTVGVKDWLWGDKETRFSLSVPDEITNGAPTDAAFVEAAQAYTGSAYKDLNFALTEGRALTAEQERIAATLRAAMGDLPSSPTVWRGVNPNLSIRVGDDAFELTADWAEATFRPGSVVSTRGFQSSSFYTEPALDASLARSQPGVLFEIAANRGAYLGKATRFDDEAELLLPDNAKFRVRKVLRRVVLDKDGDEVERTVVQLEQI